MRTTLDIDDDVLFAVKDLAASTKKSAGKVLSDLARAALQHQSTKAPTTRNGFKLLPGARNIVTTAQVDQLLESELSEWK